MADGPYPNEVSMHMYHGRWIPLQSTIDPTPLHPICFTYRRIWQMAAIDLSHYTK